MHSSPLGTLKTLDSNRVACGQLYNLQSATWQSSLRKYVILTEAVSRDNPDKILKCVAYLALANTDYKVNTSHYSIKHFQFSTNHQ